MSREEHLWKLTPCSPVCGLNQMCCGVIPTQAAPLILTMVTILTLLHTSFPHHSYPTGIEIEITVTIVISVTACPPRLFGSAPARFHRGKVKPSRWTGT